MYKLTPKTVTFKCPVSSSDVDNNRYRSLDQPEALLFNVLLQ